MADSDKVGEIVDTNKKVEERRDELGRIIVAENVPIVFNAYIELE